MRVSFDVQILLAEGMGQAVQSKEIAAIIGSEVRSVLERIELGDVTYEEAEVKLRALLENPLVNGVQATFEEL